MIAVFKQKAPGNVVLLLLFGIFLKLPLFLHPKAIVATNADGRLYQLLLDYLGSPSPIVFSLVAFALLFAQALMLNYWVHEYRLVPKANFLPSMAFMLISSLLPEWNQLSSPLVSNTLSIWSLILLFRLYNSPNVGSYIFNIGLIAGINSYIFFPSAAYGVCLLLGLLILKSFRVNEIFLFLLGCLTPYYFHAIYLFLFDRLSLPNFFPHVALRMPKFENSIWLAISTVVLTLPFLIGGYFVQNNLRKMLIQARKNWSIIVFYMLVSFFIPFIDSTDSLTTWLLITPSFAVFHAAAYFYPAKRWLPLMLFFLTMGYVLYLQFGKTV